MSKLDDAIAEHMAYIVFQEHRPFGYRDFLHFEVDGREYEMTHGTFRNKISRLIKAGEVERSYNSSLAFYSIRGIKFGKPMTTIHTEEKISHSSYSHPITRIIRNLPFGKSALHDIHLRFEVKGIWSILSANSSYKLHPISKDIRLAPIKVERIRITITVHKTDTITVVVGCSFAPIAADVMGIIKLSNALTRVEERLSIPLRSCNYCDHDDGLAVAEQVTKESRHATILPSIPEYKNWFVTMWHFGRDASIEYTGERFSTTWETGENELIRIYTKQFNNSAAAKGCKKRLRTKIRVESQEYPQSTLENAIKNILYVNHERI
jgi:hypothetical protein